MTALRLVTRNDATELPAFLTGNRGYYERSTLAHADDAYTVDGQRAHLDALPRKHDEGRALPYVLVDGSRIAGRIGLTAIQHGGLSCATLGYSVAQPMAGQGHATEWPRMPFPNSVCIARMRAP